MTDDGNPDRDLPGVHRPLPLVRERTPSTPVLAALLIAAMWGLGVGLLLGAYVF